MLVGIDKENNEITGFGSGQIFIFKQGENTVLLCTYRPPSCLDFNGLEYLEQIGHKFYNSNVVLVGDFNMPDIDWTLGKVKENSHHKQPHYFF